MILRELAQRLQLDKPLGYALLSRVWQGISGPITIALIIRYLTGDEKGIYYAIGPVIGVQAFFELGLLNVLISHAGHANAAFLLEQKEGQEPASEWSHGSSAAGRMGELIRASRRWFGVASVLFCLFVLVFGWYTFSQSDAQVDWHLPLLVIAPLAALTVYFSPSLAILEGAGERELIYRFRFYQGVCGSLAVWLALALGLGVWAVVVATLVQTAWSGYLALYHRRSFFRQFVGVSGDHGFSWMRDVLPLQWRVAAIGIAFHLATQFLVIVILVFHTAVESGRLGMTMTITTSLQMFALAWVQTKYPLISAMHGENDREGAGTLWRRTTVVSTGLLCLGFTGFTVGLLVLPLFGRGWETEFVLPWQVVLFGVGCVANHLVAIQAFYVLARGANPLVVASLIGLLTTAVAVWIGGYYWSTTGVVGAFTIGITGVMLPLHSWAYYRFRLANR